jgi:phosphoglycerate dehydrogenase-like enzyme
MPIPNGTSMKVVINAMLGKAQLQRRIAEKIADQAIWVDDADAAVNELQSADALICPDHFISAKIADAIRNNSPNLRWIQLLTAGYDHAKQHGVPTQVAVCNAGPAYAPAVAAHAVALLLAVQRRIPTVLSNQARHAWDRTFTTHLTAPASSTIVVVGFGAIGCEIGRMLRAMGARIIAVTRYGLPDQHANEVERVGNLLGVLARADAIVIAAAYDESTHHLFGDREFGACKTNAVLVNIARGAIVDSRALEAALRSGAIAGAGIDVTDPEPLPQDHSLWDAPNLIITPHCAGACGPAGGERLADLVCDNLSRFVSGTPLMHVVTI